MRERITISIVLLAVLILLGAGAVRFFTVRDLVRDQESGHLVHDVRLIGAIVTDRYDAGLPVDRTFLTDLVPASATMTYVDPAGERVVVRGADYPSDGGADDLTATDSTDAGTITLRRSADVVADIYSRDLGSLTMLFLLVALCAGVIGYVAARALSAPFQRLAVAAGALARGRFDLDLPRTRIPEARAIGQALRTSAQQLQARMSRERDFAEHASHVLRTPLTSLRMELEELTLRDDVPADVKASATRCISGVDAVNTAAGELVALSRRGSLVEGAEVTLQTLATQLAQRWADRLAERRRELSASVDGELDLTFTPGPVEHVLDQVLSDILRAGRGPVRINFFGSEAYLRVTMPAGVITDGVRRRRGPQPGAGLAEARTLAEALGGRVNGDGVTEDLEVWLPRR